MPYMTYHTRQAFFVFEYLDNLDSNAKITCRNGFIDNFSLLNDTEHTHLCKKTIYFFYCESAFPLDFLFCYFLSFLTRVRVLRRVFKMEPSTSGENIRQKRQRKSLYDQRQVLDLLLEGGSDEKLYEISSNKGNINPFQSAPPFSSNFLADFLAQICATVNHRKKLRHKRVNQNTKKILQYFFLLSTTSSHLDFWSVPWWNLSNSKIKIVQERQKTVFLSYLWEWLKSFVMSLPVVQIIWLQFYFFCCISLCCIIRLSEVIILNIAPWNLANLIARL